MPEDMVTITLTVSDAEHYARTTWSDRLHQRTGASCRAALVADNADSVKLPVRCNHEVHYGTLGPKYHHGPNTEQAWTGYCGRETTNRVGVCDEHIAEWNDNFPHNPISATDDTPEADPALVELFDRPSRLSHTWTYSQVNPGGADISHGHEFTGTDAEWAEHLAEKTYQGIEVFNAITRML